MSHSETIFVEGPLLQQAEELALYVAKRVDETSVETYPLVQQVRALESEVDAQTIVSLLFEYLNTFSTIPAEDYEPVFNQILYILCSAPSTVLDNAVPTLVKVLGDDAVSIVPVVSRLKVLANLFNLLEVSSPLRQLAFMAIIQLAASHRQLPVVDTHSRNLEQWIKQWQLSADAAVQMYLELSTTFKTHGYADASLKYLIKGLQQAENATGVPPSALKNEAIRAVHETLHNPRLYNFDQLIGLAPVRALEGEKIFVLLEIFLQDTLPRLQEFLSGSPVAVAEYQLDTDVLMTKMRHLSLASLSAQHIAEPLAYADIAAALSIPVEEVEMWVIDAIRVGLIQAKMDQMAQIIQVNRTSYRTFGPKEWSDIRDQVAAWDKSLGDILQVIGNAKLLTQQQLRSNTTVSVQAKPQKSTV
ncbi:hypothetical protein IWQ61_001717 [Dispira simplex]|nr:hypothetical protein IWQ61_001717 [Dispira simplex]